MHAAHVVGTAPESELEVRLRSRISMKSGEKLGIFILFQLYWLAYVREMRYLGSKITRMVVTQRNKKEKKRMLQLGLSEVRCEVSAISCPRNAFSKNWSPKMC